MTGWAWLAGVALAMQPAPDGWLVAARAAGPGPQCAETRAYDLATGAAFRLESCDGRVRLATGTVPRAALTDAARQLLAGQRPPDTGVLTWVLARENGSLVVGEAALPFRALDAAFAAGCAPAALPPYTRLVAEVPSMATPVSADAAQALFQAYRAARAAWLPLGTCGR